MTPLDYAHVIYSGYIQGNIVTRARVSDFASPNRTCIASIALFPAAYMLIVKHSSLPLAHSRSPDPDRVRGERKTKKKNTHTHFLSFARWKIHSRPRQEYSSRYDANQNLRFHFSSVYRVTRHADGHDASSEASPMEEEAPGGNFISRHTTEIPHGNPEIELKNTKRPSVVLINISPMFPINTGISLLRALRCCPPPSLLPSTPTYPRVRVFKMHSGRIYGFTYSRHLERL